MCGLCAGRADRCDAVLRGFAVLVVGHLFALSGPFVPMALRMSAARWGQGLVRIGTSGVRVPSRCGLEAGLIEVLARASGRVVDAPVLLKEVWGPAYGTETHYLRVFIAQLRRKLEPDPANPVSLLTEPGRGYRLVPHRAP
jgi:hypothetical protein